MKTKLGNIKESSFTTGVKKPSKLYYHTPSKLAEENFYYILASGHYYCSDKYFVKRDNFDSFLLMYVKKGNGVVGYDNKTYAAKKNDVILLNCYHPHFYSSDDWEIEWIHFDGNLSKNYCLMLYERFGCVLPLGNSRIIPIYLNRIFDSFQNNTSLNEAIVSCYIQRMLAEMYILSSQYDDVNKEQFNPVEDAVTYIENNFSSKIAIEDLASYVSLSQYHFARVFKKETGYSPHEYIVKYRINYAKRLLSNTKLSVKEIGFQSGFNSESHFTQSFRKNVNMTPKEFRCNPL